MPRALTRPSDCISLLDRADIAAGDDHVVEPDGLLILPILFGGVALVVAVMLQPEAIHFQIHVIAPANAGEFARELAINPHRLLAVGIVRCGVRLNHELPALPLIERRNDARLAGGFAFARPGWKEAVTPILVHFPIRLHIE